MFLKNNEENMLKCSECGWEVKITQIMIQPLKEKIKCSGCWLTRIENDWEYEITVDMSDICEHCKRCSKSEWSDYCEECLLELSEL